MVNYRGIFVRGKGIPRATVVIRLKTQRLRKQSGRVFFEIWACDGRRPLAKLGHGDSSLISRRGAKKFDKYSIFNHLFIRIDFDRLAFWVKNGAKIDSTLGDMVLGHGEL